MITEQRAIYDDALNNAAVDVQGFCFFGLTECICWLQEWPAPARSIRVD
jgi:hypothetical protein